MKAPSRLRFLSHSPPPGNLTKTCTEDGWTPLSIDYAVDCGFDPNDTVVYDHEVGAA